MYLLGRKPAPDHVTIARFRSDRLPGVIDDLHDQYVRLLAEMGELSQESVFIDGTKLEANANRYSFVWKKAPQKNEAKMQEKMKSELPKLASEFGLRFHTGEKIRARDLKKLWKQLKKQQAEQGVVNVHGKGQPNTSLNRIIKNIMYTGVIKNGESQSNCIDELRIISDDIYQQAQENHAPTHTATQLGSAQQQRKIAACWKHLLCSLR